MSPVKIIKHSGEEELFSDQKLLSSLKRSGVSSEAAKEILREVKDRLYPGIKTKEIYKLAHRLLRQKSRKFAANYSLKKAILKLGPTGYYFEKFVAHMFRAWGYEADVDIVFQGKCVPHEVDVVAKRKDKTVFVECKFHNNPSKKNDIKTVLYIQSRRIDLMESNKCPKFNEFHLISNTTFSKDAIAYANCMGLEILGLNSPGKATFHEVVRKYDLHPVTCLKRLRVKHMNFLLEEGIILCKELQAKKIILKKLGLKQAEIKSIMNEIEDIMEASQ